MPPNDDAFAQPTTTAAPAPAPAAAPNPTPAAPAPAYVTSDQLKEAFQGFASELTQALATTAPAPKATSPDEWQSKFFEDPRGAIVNEINSETKNTVVMFAKAQAESMLGDMKHDFDGKWGSGAWDTYVKDRMEGAVKSTLQREPMNLVNKEMLNNAVKALTGEHADDLFKHREGHTTKLRETTEAEENARMERIKRELPGLTGGIRLTAMSDGKQTLGPEAKEFMDTYFKNTGERLNEQELLASLNSGTSYDEWKAAQPKAGK